MQPIIEYLQAELPLWAQLIVFGALRSLEIYLRSRGIILPPFKQKKVNPDA